MIGLASLALKGKGLLAGAVLLALVSAWGGLGWYGKARVERAFSDYRFLQAKLVIHQQETIIAEQARADEVARAASNLYAAGQKITEEKYAPEIATLESLARAYRERLRHRAGPDSSAVPATGPPAGGPAAAACEVRLLGITEAAQAVARDLESAEREVRKLEALQAWARDIASKPR